MNGSPASHPSRHQLKDFLQGRLGGVRADEIERHVCDCETCCETLSELNTEADPFLSLLRTDVWESDSESEEAKEEEEKPPTDAAEGRHEGTGSWIGPYRLMEPLGEGGMGVVYRAEQRHPLRRTVALKIIKPGMDSRQVIARFQAERQALALMDHAHITRVLDVGTIQSGRPYYITELIEGPPITDYCNRHRLALRERLELFVPVCYAVHHAHQKGIIHRDIKPSNVLVSEANGRAIPKVIDFGVAKALEEPLTEHSLHTRCGQIVGTLEYMSPEQAALNREDIDTRSDVYALGVLLYELLTGRTPLERARKRDSTFDELLRSIREQEPDKPSVRVQGSNTDEKTSARISLEARQIASQLSGDLDAIVMKALEKKRNRRYDTAGAFAADVERYLNGEPIDARRITAWDRFVRWSRRKPALAALLGVMVMLAVVGFPGVTLLWLDAARSRDQALRSERAERWSSYRANVAAAGSFLDLDNADAARRALQAAPPEHRNWEWRHYWQRLYATRLVLEGHRHSVWSVAFSPDGRRIASLSADSADADVRLWDAQSGQIVKVLPGDRAGNRPSGVAFSPDSRLLAAQGPGGSICLYVAEDGRRQAILPGHEGYPAETFFNPDGTKLLSRADGDTMVRLWDVRSRTESQHWDLQAHVDWIGFSPDGKFFAAATGAGIVSVWDADKCVLVARWSAHQTPIAAAAFSPDGRRLVTSSTDHIDRESHLWSVPGGKLIATMPGHDNAVYAVRFSPDGSTLASASIDQTVRLWDGRTGDAMATLRGHVGAVHDIQFSPDGSRLASASRDSTVRIWNPADGSLQAVFYGHTGEVNSLRFSPSGDTLATASNDRTVSLWDVKHSICTNVIRGHTSYVYDVAYSPDGQHVASAAWDGTFRLWSVSTGKELLRFDAGSPKIATGVAFDPSGDRLATLERGAMRLWDLKSGECLHRVDLAEGHYPDARIAFSPNGELIAAGTSDGEIWWWDGSGKRVAVTPAHSGYCRDVAFSPDSLRVASAGHDGRVQVWDVASKKRIATLQGHRRSVTSVTFNATGTLLATGSEDGTARLWDAHDFTERAVLEHGRNVYDVAFHPDGTRLATACVDSSIRIWDVATSSQAAELRGHEEYVHAIDFSPDGTQLVSGSGDFTIRVWDTQPATERTDPKRQRR